MTGTEFVSTQTIVTMGAAAFAVTAMSNTLRRVFKVAPIKTTFYASLTVAFLRVAVLSPKDIVEWLLAFINACILFCTAIGINDCGGQVERQIRRTRKGMFPPSQDTSTQDGMFFAPWFSIK